MPRTNLSFTCMVARTHILVLLPSSCLRSPKHMGLSTDLNATEASLSRWLYKAKDHAR
jgi:hypothetical protein